ncbi:MAG TPA: class I SAM-dependent methyltransferase [Alphaproteobacteria bacterium]|nr:class I SAM-dependent methyltransferase [Alphaproteobacteria bacterium]
MNLLAETLTREIRDHGPISVARYMAAALGHPEHGYYRKQIPFGTAGDFVTAPEVSQMFGELIGLWCAEAWRHMGMPSPILLVELGPGRGTLMKDALRVASVVPDFKRTIDPHLVETSPTLISVQRTNVQGSWHDRFEDVPRGPLLVIANEFFDALPIHQFEKKGDGWHERQVGLNDSGEFVYTSAQQPCSERPPIPETLEGLGPGAIVETCPDGLALAGTLADRVCRDGGAALIIDYGHVQSAPGETLQAVKSHSYHPVLSEPGDADVTAHVDFAALKKTAEERGAAVLGPVPQGCFLRDLGIEQRADALRRGATAAQARDIQSGLMRLTDPRAMGQLFKVMAIVHPALTGLEGFASTE